MKLTLCISWKYVIWRDIMTHNSNDCTINVTVNVQWGGLLVGEIISHAHIYNCQSLSLCLDVHLVNVYIHNEQCHFKWFSIAFMPNTETFVDNWMIQLKFSYQYSCLGEARDHIPYIYNNSTGQTSVTTWLGRGDN